MSAKNFVIFYVDKPEASAAFYSALLNRPPVESSPTFALFALDSGLMLGLWSRHTVEPAAAGRGGCTELAFTVPDAEALGQCHRDWSLRGLAILQAPTNMDFGRTFVALDPDGHRLRVFSPAPDTVPAADEPVTIPAFPGA
ncbi:MAG: VOC family protein [Achromobacter pulmonis]|uniref:Phenazine antibiotic resistance protein EhpR n=1 Tax=Achromobacter pulmonis TaxID=1389932 RepID=A0A6S7EFN3_9BURK|nr:VOC family protein [Achromobacter pulmonis]MCF7768657.1 VOC family protein [Achromobacter pulmonis]MPT28562.1 drug:proton antiporter [Achromobacter sp.]CAB3648678.1 Phenazine antibiotic resistance protein EhpR [Achromobacter pulmonis]CAB3906502.1 Phenazine antibiotic resistance protein EhpR [Achromobacter pulmonis]